MDVGSHVDHERLRDLLDSTHHQLPDLTDRLGLSKALLNVRAALHRLAIAFALGIFIGYRRAPPRIHAFHVALKGDIQASSA